MREGESSEEGFAVTVVFPDGDCGEVDAVGSQTVGALRRQVEQTYGRAAATTKLTCDGVELAHHRRLADYSIGSESVVFQQMQVYVCFLSQPGFFLDVNPHVSVAEMKAMVESKDAKFPMHQLRLFAEGVHLEDHQTLSQCNVEDGENLFAFAREDPLPEGAFQVYVQRDGTVHCVDTEPTATIAEVKRRVCRQISEEARGAETVLPERQRLSFGGQYLEDASQTLWECGISREYRLHLVPESDIGAPAEDDSDARRGTDLPRRSAPTTDGDDAITVFLLDESQADGRPFQMGRETSLRDVFDEYARTVGVPTSRLRFACGEHGALPPDCDFTAGMLGIGDGDIILVSAEPGGAAAPFAPAVAAHHALLAGTAAVGGALDLTFGADAEDVITVLVTLLGSRDTVPATIDRTSTTLGLVFGSFAERCYPDDPATLFYVCDARRFLHDADDTAATAGLVDGDAFYALPPEAPAWPMPPGPGKVAFHLLVMGRPDSEKEFFRADAHAPLGHFFHSFAARKDMELSRLRFLHRGKVLYADAYETRTPAQLGMRDGDSNTVRVLVRERHRSLAITPNAVGTASSMSPNDIFEPVLQVLHLDEKNQTVRTTVLYE